MDYEALLLQMEAEEAKGDAEQELPGSGGAPAESSGAAPGGEAEAPVVALAPRRSPRRPRAVGSGGSGPP